MATCARPRFGARDARLAGRRVPATKHGTTVVLPSRSPPAVSYTHLAPIPKLKDNYTFLITEYSTDKKYGYDKDYPVNVFFKSIKNESINEERFLNALAGPNGETISYKKTETC